MQQQLDWRKAPASGSATGSCGLALCPRPFQAAARTGARAWRLRVQAGQGFGQAAGQKTSSAKQPKKEKKSPKLERYLELDTAGAAAQAEGWTRVASLADFVSKPLKAVILETGKAIVVYKVGDKVYCSDANSTAYQFPLVDATIMQTKSGPAVEVPLDGTTYDLATGKVLSWCPKNTAVRKVLGALKDTSSPVDLAVYPAEARGQDVFVKFG